ncbi:hypothetical protein HDU79_006347 [Rhizoclosmatium sp. JEL0117]|nr:hypothetical protein HDU79_006347 [Rhizoclosmatium sp. JEL0117]
MTTVTVTSAPDRHTFTISIKEGVQVTRTSSEADHLFTCLLLKHPLFCFGLSAPIKSKETSAVAKHVELRTLKAFVSSVSVRPTLMDDAELVKPFFESVFKYAPDPVTPAPLASRRSASTFTLVFSQKKDDVDVFFNQVRLHIDAVHGKVKTIVKDVDVLAGMQIDYATCLHDLDLLMADLSLHESLDPIASSYRKLCKTLSHLSASFNSLSDFLITNTRPSLYSYRRSMEAMRVSLDARLVALDEYEDACKNGVKKQKDLERMQASASTGVSVYQARAEQAVQEFRLAKQEEEVAKERFISATDLIRESYAPVRNAQADELQLVMNEYVENQLATNRDILEAIQVWIA